MFPTFMTQLMTQTLDSYCDEIHLGDQSIHIAQASVWKGFSIFALLEKGFTVSEASPVEKTIYDPDGLQCGFIRLKSLPRYDTLTGIPVDTVLHYELQIRSTPKVDEAVKDMYPNYKKASV